MRWEKKGYLKKLWLENFQIDLKCITTDLKSLKQKPKGKKNI